MTGGSLEHQKEMEIRDFEARIDSMLSEGYALWNGFGLEPLGDEELHFVPDRVYFCCSGRHRENLAAACQSFYLFRRLHFMTEAGPEQTTLLGDYFFSSFSRYLIPIDSTRLTDRFSEYLKQDAQEGAGGRRAFSKETYARFIREISGMEELC